MTGSIQGYVVTERSTPVPDASIVVSGGSGSVPDIAPITNDAGSFVLDGLPEGTYRLQAFGPGGETGAASVEVFAHSVTDTTIVVGSDDWPGVPEVSGRPGE